MARCFRRKGDSQRAILAFKKALSLNAFDKDVHAELAKAYNEGGYPDKGIQHFRQALKIDAKFIDAKFNLALCLELQGELNEPTGLYRDIIEQDKDFLPAYNNLGSIYMRQGLYKEAEASVSATNFHGARFFPRIPGSCLKPGPIEPPKRSIELLRKTAGDESQYP